MLRNKDKFKGKLKLATFGAVLATPFAAMPAMASSCFIGESAPASFSCSESSVTYQGLTFSNIVVTALVTGSGTIVLGGLTTTTAAPGEYGLQLTYTAQTGATAGSQADVSLTYAVSGASIDDAYASFSGTVTGTGTQSLAETLSNGYTLSLNAAGAVSTTFSPISYLTAGKDQNDFSGSAGSATSSIMVNAYSLAATPIPATLPLLATGLLGLWGVSRKRRKKGSRLGSAQAS
jgi:hypothetical protein